MLGFFIDGRKKWVSYNLFTKLFQESFRNENILFFFQCYDQLVFCHSDIDFLKKKKISSNLTQISLRKGVCLQLRRARHSELILKLYPSLSLSYRGVAHLCPGQERVCSRTQAHIQCRHIAVQWQKSAIVRG